MLGDSEVDAIAVCVPNNMHAPISIDALKAGKHVLCEKPAARTYEEALEMQSARNGTGKTLNIGVGNRFNDNVNLLKDFIQSGKLGNVYHVNVSFRSHRSIPGLGGAFTTKDIAGGGVLIDWGVHFLDIVMYCCGDPELKTVSGETFCMLGKDIKGYVYREMWAGPPDPAGVFDVDDSVTALVRTTGPVISLHGAWAQNIEEDQMYIDFMGDKAGIRLKYGSDFTVYATENGSLFNYKPFVRSRNHFENEIDSFVDCILKGHKNQSDIDTVITTARMMQAIYDSAQQHKEISF